MRMSAPAPDAERRAARTAALAVAAACGTWMTLLFVQVRHPFPFLNDSILHFGLIRSLASAPERGQDLLDPWVGTWCSGFPAFHYYQSLPHFLVLGLWKLLLGTVSLVRTFKLVEWLAVATFPLPVYLAMRRLGADRLASAAAAVLSPLAKTNYLHGHDFESYTWQGLGQYTQAVGGWIFPLAVARIATALRDGRGWAGAAVLLSLMFLAHLMLGTMGAMAGIVMVLLAPRDIPRRLLRLAVIGAVTGVACAWILLPIVRDFAWYNVSTIIPSWKYNSFGAPTILRWLVHGEIFDYARTLTVAGRTLGPLPILSVLVGGGLVLAAFRARRDPERTLLALFLVFLLLFFGRPTWGELLRVIPLGSGFHYSRAVFAVHVFGVMLAGVFSAWLLRRIAALRPAGVPAASALAVLLLAPLVAERAAYLRHNADLVRQSADGYARDGAALERALDLAAADRFGRVYGGPGAAGQPWGGSFMVGWVPVYSWFPVREMDALGFLHHMWSLNADVQTYFDERNPVHYRVFGVRRVICPTDLPYPRFAHEVGREGRFRVLAVDGPGLLELVDSPWQLDVSKRNLSRLQAAWLRSPLPAQSVYPRVRLAEEGPSPGGIAADAVTFDFPDRVRDSSPVGEILDQRRRGDDFEVRVRVDRPGHLLLRMSFEPGWRATVDGTEVRPVPLMPSYVGVPLEPGVHEVSFRYRPRDSRRVLLAVGVLALLGAGAFGRRIPLGIR